MADTVSAATRFGLEPDLVEERLLDAQAFGWVTWSQFAGTGGWSLTTAGREQNQRELAAELAATGGRAVVQRVHEDFLPLNARLQRACTDWQLRPAPGDPLAANDHTDRAWDGQVLHELADLAEAVVPLVSRLTEVLVRFEGYDVRLAQALRLAGAGDPGWVDGTGRDSCHAVWFELHEDLLATLGLERS